MKNKKIALTLGVSFAATVSLLATSSSEKYLYDASGNIVEQQVGSEKNTFSYNANFLTGSVVGGGREDLSV